MLLENPTDDSVEVAIGFLKECGLKLSQVAPKGMHGMNVCITLYSVTYVHTVIIGNFRLKYLGVYSAHAMGQV